MSFRASTGNLSLYDDSRHDAPTERWDREKFERISRRNADDRERESIHFRESDRFGPDRKRHEFEFDERIDRHGLRTRVEEKERFVEKDYPSPSRKRFDIRDYQEASDVANRALAPYRRKSIAEHRDMDIEIRTSSRPQYIRRQSSLDTFDRRPSRRHPHDRDEWRPPANVPIPLPIRQRSKSRRRSPPRSRYREEDYEEIRYRDVDSDNEYHDIHIKREKSRRRRAKSRARSQARSRRSSSSSSSDSSFEEISPINSKGKRGRTRMPKRLVHKSAIVELGYPFEEEEDFFIIRRALEKEQIDEVMQVSEIYKKKTTTYRYEHTDNNIPPPPESVRDVRSSHSEIVIPAPPPPEVIYVPAPAPAPESSRAHSVRSISPSRHTVIEERVEESNHIGGPFTVVLPERRHRSTREIESEIRHLERERRELKYERDSDRYDYELVERRDPERNIIRLDRDRKARTPRHPKTLAAMITTLT